QYYNHLSLKDYVKNIKAGRLPIYVGKQLPPEEQKRRHIIFSLKIRDGIDKKQYRSQFKKEFTDEFHKKLKHLHELGLIEETNSRVRLTEKGLLFPDEIAKQFYSDEVSRKLCLGCP
ncbi:MAG: hypothetical protein KKD39_05110, partial [Candidatus Altiarchaeota archaeon]|nr:hypothetical protein [Candidatus Altiarchaeota archaeon]